VTDSESLDASFLDRRASSALVVLGDTAPTMVAIGTRARSSGTQKK
jgi:hypothetical protein